jgi:hypothetical protein
VVAASRWWSGGSCWWVTGSTPMRRSFFRMCVFQ